MNTLLRLCKCVFVLSCIAASLCLPAGGARGDEWGPGDFRGWQNRPREPFRDGERAFRRAREILLKEYADEKLTEDDLYRAAVAGMLAGAGGRKWDVLLSPAEMAELRGDLAGEVVGVGVEIKFDSDSGVTQVMAVIPTGPAEKAGVLTGDRILKIDGRSFKGAQLRDVVYSIRGKAGDPVSLTLLRDDKVQTLAVKREALAFAPVEESMLPDRTAVIVLRSFNEKTPGLLSAALTRISQKSPRGLIVDLRNDEGGLVEAMLECAGMLLPKGSLVMTTLGRSAAETPHRTAREPLVSSLPMVVLINAKTASSAEIIAGALKQAAGARLIGTKTFGKWNMQMLMDLPNAYAMKFTIGVFKSAGGQLLDGKGLEPDIEVDMDPTAVEKAQRLPPSDARIAADPQLRAALGLIRLR